MSVGRVVAEVGLGLALVAAYAGQMLRWLRVLQREHYEPSSMRRFLGRWSTPPVVAASAVGRTKIQRPITLSHVLAVGLVVCVVVRVDALAVLFSAAYGMFCPMGLSIKGRTSALQWTRRLTTIAVVASVFSLVVAITGVWTVRPWLLAVAMVWAVPLTLDLSVRALGPYEHRRAQAFVDQAARRLERIHPRVVAVTGSFGKTSTKNHLAELLGSDGGVVASPKSFNNRAGLSRTINEQLADGTGILIAEMGMFQPGEIRALCEWCPPEIAVVTAIGPVHLERMKSVDAIEAAKFEVTEKARVVVLNIDDLRLARWVERLRDADKVVRTAGSRNVDASVRVVDEHDAWTLIVDGVSVGSTPAVPGLQSTNVACAVAAALELGVSAPELAARVGRLSPVANRSHVLAGASGVVVIDDTFNANPASAESAIKLLASLDLSGRRVVITPGLIELGSEQYASNMSLAQKVVAMGGELVVVGRTNAEALSAGYERRPLRFDVRDEAVAWVRSSLVPGDGVLYLNDLPDHYP